HRSGAYAQLDTGRTRLALYERAAMGGTLGWELRGPGPEHAAFELGFKVPDVDAAVEAFVAAGADVVTAPTDRPWGQRTAYLADPDGNLVELAEDSTPAAD
ncbi:MAG: VOC family protein, partial [Acidimicrobiales bacterium]|nr:VOC family protein [Acidimicrobiales bacterium]